MLVLCILLSACPQRTNPLITGDTDMFDTETDYQDLLDWDETELNDYLREFQQEDA